MTRRRSQQGSAPLTLVLFTPVILVLIAFAVYVGRLGSTEQDVLSAAQDGARAVAATAKPNAAHGAAGATLANRGVSCANRNVAVNATQLRPGGFVQVTVSCTVSGQGLAPGFSPPTRTIVESATAPVNRYQGGSG